jgi:hypothetical protein
MDGRTQFPVIEWIKNQNGCDFVDMITEPGISESIAGKDNMLEQIAWKINISLEKHLSEEIFIAGHHDCAACCRSESGQKEDIMKAVKKIKDLFPKFPVTGLWVNENWEVEVVCVLEGII